MTSLKPALSMKRDRYAPSKPELFRWIERDVREGDLDLAWRRLRILIARCEAARAKREKKGQAA